MKINERIKLLRKELGLTQLALAEKIGVNRVSVTNWESGGSNHAKPSGDHLLNLAKALNTTPRFILSGDVQEQPHNDKGGTLGGFDTWDSRTPLNDDDVELPFFKEVELSAGIGSEVVREDEGFKLRFSKSTLKRNNIDPSNAACVQINGDSMEPILPDGSTVGIDTSKTQIIDGKMYAIDHGGLLRVKVLHRIPGGLRVRSFNSDEHPDEIYKGDELNDIRVIGKVFWSAAFHF